MSDNNSTLEETLHQVLRSFRTGTLCSPFLNHELTEADAHRIQFQYSNHAIYQRCPLRGGMRSITVPVAVAVQK